MTTYSYFYLSRNLEKCMMRFNLRIGHVITQITNAKKMNNSDRSTQKIPNSYVFSLDENKSKSINADKSEKKGYCKRMLF